MCLEIIYLMLMYTEGLALKTLHKTIKPNQTKPNQNHFQCISIIKLFPGYFYDKINFNVF